MRTERARSRTSAERCGGCLLSQTEEKENKMNLSRSRSTVSVLAAGILLTVAMLLPSSQPTRAAGPWYVAPGGDDSNDCLSPATPCATINGAIGKASSGDTIFVAVGTYTGTGDAVVLLDRDAILSGGWDVTFTTQSSTSTIDGELSRRGIRVYGAETVVIERFIVQNGSTNWPVGGGGISNHSTLTLTNSVVKDNTAETRGGGIYSSGNLILNNSTVSGNTSGEGGAGILHAGGPMVLINSTVSGNSTIYSGGGVYSEGYDASLTLNNSTVSANKAGSAGGIYRRGDSSVTMKNTILAGNTASSDPDCNGGLTSAGHNLVGNTSGCDLSPSTGDLTDLSANLGALIGFPGYHPLLSGSPAIDAGDPSGCTDHQGNPLSTDQRGADRVGRCDIGAYEYTTPGPAAALSAFGGSPQRTPPFSTYGVPLQALVLDAIGTPVGDVVVTFRAPASGASGTFADTGTHTTTAATFETGIAAAASFTANGIRESYSVTATVGGLASAATFLLTNTGWYVSPSGSDGSDCQTPATPCATINGVLGKPGFSAADTVLVASGAYTGSGEEVVLMDRTARLLGGWDQIYTTQIGRSIIDGEGSRRCMAVSSGATTTIERFAFLNGSIGGSGGGVYNDGGIVTLDRCIVSNTASRAAIHNCQNSTLSLNNSAVSGNTGNGIRNSGNLTLNNSTVTGNVSSETGGGIYGGGAITLNNSTVSGNSARMGGGIDSYGALILNNSTVSGNTATYDTARGGGIQVSQGTATLNSSTVSDNTSAYGGGGIYNLGYTVVLRNSILAGNASAQPGTITPDCAGDISSSGHNLIGNIGHCAFIPATGDLTNIDPKLGPLEGSPGYHPLLADSPAVDAGNPAGCTNHLGNPLSTDQRDFPRFGRCDIGSYELQPVGFSTKTSSVPTVEPLESLTYTITLRNNGVVDVPGVRLTDTLPISLTYLVGSLAATSGAAEYADGMITWAGTVSAGLGVSVTFGADVGSECGVIQNQAIISGGGEIFTRTATVHVVTRIYLPLVLKGEG